MKLPDNYEVFVPVIGEVWPEVYLCKYKESTGDWVPGKRKACIQSHSSVLEYARPIPTQEVIAETETPITPLDVNALKADYKKARKELLKEQKGWLCGKENDPGCGDYDMCLKKMINKYLAAKKAWKEAKSG